MNPTDCRKEHLVVFHRIVASDKTHNDGICCQAELLAKPFSSRYIRMKAVKFKPIWNDLKYFRTKTLSYVRQAARF